MTWCARCLCSSIPQSGVVALPVSVSAVTVSARRPPALLPRLPHSLLPLLSLLLLPCSLNVPPKMVIPLLQCPIVVVTVADRHSRVRKGRISRWRAAMTTLSLRSVSGVYWSFAIRYVLPIPATM